MHRVSKLILVGVSLAMLVASPALSASLDWTFTNHTAYTVRVKLFQDDYNYVWPSSDTSRELGPFDTITFPATDAIAGSQVCFGAYTEDNDSIYWGNGRYGKSTSPSANCVTPDDGHNTASSSIDY